jgi:hypothetical protein
VPPAVDFRQRLRGIKSKYLGKVEYFNCQPIHNSWNRVEPVNVFLQNHIRLGGRSSRASDRQFESERTFQGWPGVIHFAREVICHGQTLFG